MTTMVRQGPAETAKALGELGAVMQQELRLLEELRQALRRQRDGVAAGDAPAIEDSVAAVGRTLLTLDASRRRRGSLVALLAGADGSLEQVERAIGMPLPASMLESRAALRRAAESVQREVRTNQTVLRRCLEAGDAFLQELFATASDRTPTYDAGAATAEGPGRPVLLDRTA